MAETMAGEFVAAEYDVESGFSEVGQRGAASPGGRF